MDFMQTITEWAIIVTNFVTSDSFQAFVTAILGVSTTIALLQNKIASLKVATTQVQMAAQNNAISSLENKVVSQSKELVLVQEQNKLLSSKLDALLDINATAFLASRLDTPTRTFIKERFVKVSADTKPLKVQDKKGKLVETLPEVVETGLQAVENIINSPVIDQVKTLAQKMKVME